MHPGLSPQGHEGSARHAAGLYRPSGKMPGSGWGWLLLLLALAATAGGIEAFIYDSKPVLALIISVAVGMWIGFGGTFFVLEAQCRNRPLALAAGLLAGIFFLLSAWTIDQYRERGEADLSSLVSYMTWRVETGKHVGLDDGREHPPRLVGWRWSLSWLAFWAQLAGTLFLSALLPWRIVRTDPYCEACGVFMSRDISALALGSSADAVAAVRAGTLHALLDDIGMPYNPGMAATLVAKHACPDGRTCGHAEGYASIFDADGTPNLAGPFHPSNLFFGRIPMELGRLASSDLAALLPRLAASRDGDAYLAESDLAKSDLAEIGPAENSLADAHTGSSAEKFHDGAKGHGAQIEDIRDRTVGAVLDKPSIAYSLLLQFFPVVAIGGGLFLMAYLVEHPALGALGPALTALVGLVLVGILVVFFRDINFFEGLLPFLKCKSSFSSRADPLVDPDDPRAFFVDVIPRANWGRTMAENASDIGFLRVDKDRQAVLFEGDRQRYSIPVRYLSAIELTHLGGSVENAGFEVSQRPVVILHVESEQTTLEIPLVLRHSRLWETVRYGGRGNFNRLVRAFQSLMPTDR